MSHDRSQTAPRIDCAMQDKCPRADYMRALYRYLRVHNVDEVALRQSYVTDVMGWALPRSACDGACGSHSHL